jgi:hypothetical protein
MVESTVDRYQEFPWGNSRVVGFLRFCSGPSGHGLIGTRREFIIAEEIYNKIHQNNKNKIIYIKIC